MGTMLLRDLLTPASQVKVTITLKIAGIAFEGSDTIMAMNP